MKTIHQDYDITLSIRVEVAPEHLSKDVAMLDLLEGVGDKRKSGYTKKKVYCRN